ncbi:MAG TPA: sulfotransferase, partial [Acidimicrobiia bacterium]|nr:sulfotransferase [Acidimicrobiia bacterium]
LFHLHHAERAGKRRWGDKSLHTEHYADRVFAEYPDARIVHMVRDPRDRYASVRRRHGQDLSRVGAATGRWRSSMRAARRNLRRHPGRYLVVRYEDIVDDPEATMQRVCRFAGLDYTPAMLAMTGAPDHRDTGGNSSFGDVEVQSISAKAVGRYRSVLTQGEIAFIQCVVRRDMAVTRYEPADIGFTLAERARFALWELPSQFARMLGATSFEWMQRKRGARVSAPKHRVAS